MSIQEEHVIKQSIEQTSWRGFKDGLWMHQINVREFIEQNITPFEGNAEFLLGPTEATTALWSIIQKLTKEEIAHGGVLDVDVNTVSTITSHGPGIRFVLFMQGCALQCQYCHNPDSWDTQIGKVVHVEDVLVEIEPYIHYYKGSGGGITVSGGEPTLQAPFVAELFKACKEKWNLHTTLDSSGFCESSHAEQLMSYTDLVLLDLKQMNNQRHQVLTGQSNERILKFARWLSDRGTAMWIRHVLVPGRTDDEQDLVALGQFIGSLNGVERIEILPYHRMGIYKWEQLGKRYGLTGVGSPTDQEVERAYRIIEAARAGVCL